jgi:hypothetical protein
VCGKGVDEAGNTSPWPCGSMHWTVDTSGPVLSVISPTNNTAMLNSTMTLLLEPNEPLAELLVLWPGANLWTRASPGVTTTEIGSTSLRQRHLVVSVVATVYSDGLHWVDVKGVDQVGNVQLHALRFYWERDTTAPTVWLTGTDRLPAATSTTSLRFSYECDDSTALVWWAVDGGSGWTQLVNTSSFTAAVEGEGQHFLLLKAVDGVGNERVNASAWVWTLDTVPPTAVITTVPDSPSAVSNPVFQLTCTSVAPGGAPDCASFAYTVALSPVTGCTDVVTHRGVVGGDGVLQLTGVRSGQNTVKVTAVDAVGLRQEVVMSFGWSVKLATDVIAVRFLSGPPAIYSYRVATIAFYAHRNESVVSNCKFEVKLDEASWEEGSFLCGKAVCNYTFPVKLGVHEIQIRAVDRASSIAGPPALWRWSVEECREDQYANITGDGSLACEPCPTGGDCKAKGATAHSLVAKPGWWVPPQGPRLTLYRCPLPGSCLGGNESVCAASLGFKNSTLCGQCLPHYVRRGEGCTRCPHISQVRIYCSC